MTTVAHVSPPRACRNFHGEAIDPWQCNFTANGHAGDRAGMCNMTYDAVARHASFCDRRQLYHLERDPLEQHNEAEAHPEVYDELLNLIIAHVRRVEAGNPVVGYNRPTIYQCARSPPQRRRLNATRRGSL